MASSSSSVSFNKNGRDVDYYTPDMLESIWIPQWFELIQFGAWAKGEVPMPPIEPLHQLFHPYACNSCKRSALTNHNSLSTCTNCRVVSYCSKDCQTRDWKHHKAWCKAFQTLLQEGKISNMCKFKSLHAWRDGMSLLTPMLDQKMGGFPHRTYMQIGMLQPRCRKCFQAGFRVLDDRDGNNKIQTEKVHLNICPRCNGVALCDTCLKEEKQRSNGSGDMSFHRDCQNDNNPKLECDEHLLALCCLGMVVEQGNPLGLPSSTDCSEQWIPKDWLEYFGRKRTDYEIPRDLFQLAPVPAFLSNSHSHVLTLQHVLFDVLPTLAAKDDSLHLPYTRTTKKLVIHLCGATMDDTIMPGRFIEMIRLNPQIDEFQLHFFGPDQIDLSDLNAAIQKEDIRSSCKVSMRQHIGLYHTIMKSQSFKGNTVAIEPPTVVFCPHPGVHDPPYTESWRDTMKYVVLKNFLLVVTGCDYQEGVNDCKFLREWGANVVVEPRTNPFRGLWPLPNPSRDNGDYFYTNASYFVVKGGMSLSRTGIH